MLKPSLPRADEEAATASVDVPPSLSRVVLLASSMSGGAASAGSTSGRAHAVGKQRRTAAEWEVGDGTRGAYGHGPQEVRKNSCGMTISTCTTTHPDEQSRTCICTPGGNPRQTSHELNSTAAQGDLPTLRIRSQNICHETR